MEKLVYEQGYIQNVEKREKLYPLFEKVFGIDTAILREFYARGLWTGAFKPYTFFDGGRAVANVSAFPLEMKIGGKFLACAGIQSVMTDPIYRGQGLMRTLFSRMLADLEKEADGAFLFTSTPELYTPYGFEVVPQFYFRAKASMPMAGSPLKKLDPYLDEDVFILTELLSVHEPVSEEFAPVGYKHPFFFNLYRPQVGGAMYWIEDLGTVAVFEKVGETIRLYDLIAETLPQFDTLCSYLPGPYSSIEIYFPPDLLSLDRVEAVPFPTENRLMFKGSFPLGGEKKIMPLTAEF